jgi:hypothetical protein
MDTLHTKRLPQIRVRRDTVDRNAMLSCQTIQPELDPFVMAVLAVGLIHPRLLAHVQEVVRLMNGAQDLLVGGVYRKLGSSS